MEKIRRKKITTIVFGILILSAGIIFLSGQVKKNAAPTKETGVLQEAKPPVAEGEIEKVIFATNQAGEAAHKIKRDGKWCVSWRGTEGKCYDSVSRPLFSQDGNQFAYAAEIDGHWVVVLNNQEETVAYDVVSAIVFSPDGSRVAIVAAKEEKELVILDGEEGNEYEAILTLETWSGAVGPVIFSSDGEDVAYKAEVGDQEMVVINEKENEQYDEIGNFDFSEDGNQFAYEAETGSAEVVVINGQETSASNPPPAPTAPVASAGDNSGSSSVSSGNVNNSNRPRFTVCEKNVATGEDCNF